ncbi:MAG: caspase family protein [Acidobacteriota bacterium]
MADRAIALLVGIETYPNLDQSQRLRGTLNDVDAMVALLLERRSDIDLRIMRDKQATRAAVLAALDQLTADADADTEVLFYWSGHGSQLFDATGASGDEEDGRDETLVPFDSGRGTKPNLDIVDDELRAWLARLNAVTQRVTLIVDSCHSGTIPRAGIRLAPADRRPPPVGPLPSAPTTPAGPSGPAGWLPVSNDWVLLAACRDGQIAVELPLDGQMRGVFSWALEQAVRSSPPGATWRQLFALAEVPFGFMLSGKQTPQLEGRSQRVSIFG